MNHSSFSRSLPSSSSSGNKASKLAARLLGLGGALLVVSAFAAGCGEDAGEDAAPCGELKDGGSLRNDESVISCNGKYKFINQGDGNVVLYHPGDKPVWSSSTVGPLGTLSLQSGELRLVGSSGTVLYQSKSGGHPGAKLLIQDDGNAVIYDTNNQPVWETGIVDSGGSGGGSKGCTSNSDCHDSCKRCVLSTGQCVSKAGC
jgi:hypothetical protein